jgi:hypothetical protein
VGQSPNLAKKGFIMQQNYLIELDGKATGRLFAFKGGSVAGEVSTVVSGSNPEAVEYEQFSSENWWFGSRMR